MDAGKSSGLVEYQVIDKGTSMLVPGRHLSLLQPPLR
jgi:hypothetical protein